MDGKMDRIVIRIDRSGYCSSGIASRTHYGYEKTHGFKRSRLHCLIPVLLIAFACSDESTSLPPNAGATGGNAAQSGFGGMSDSGASAGDGERGITTNDGSVHDQLVADAHTGGVGGSVDASIALGDTSFTYQDTSIEPEDTVTGESGDPDTTIPIDASETDGESNRLSDVQMLIPHPSWNCGMPEGIPPPKSGQLVFEAELTIGEIHDLGQTQYGHRHQIDITGGSLNGARINARFLTGGLDYQLTLSNGALEVEQINVLQTDDGTPIYFRNCGTSPGEGSEVRVVPDFEAPDSSAYAWLNTGTFVGVRALDMTTKSLTMSFYDVSAIPAVGESVTVTEPEDVPDQTWTCKKASGNIGTEVYSETVNLGSSLLVGASKYGTRNIIPIIGGTATGRIAGTVLAGGADYQILAPGFEFDARYTIRTNDGELIIVRNCGTFGSLVPVFETRIDGNYAWINENRWLSSDPGLGLGSVTLTIYERN